MKKILKSRIFLVIITAIICTSIGVSATILYQADEIGFTPTNSDWEVDNLEDALNDLYNGAGAGNITKFCSYVNSEYVDTTRFQTTNHYAIGTKYSCDPGDGTSRNFYVLAVNGDNVDLIMDSNIATGTMSWYSAINYFDTNSNGISIKSAWDNVIDVDLPKAQDIANAANKQNWIAGNNSDWWCLETGEQDQPGGPKFCLTSQETEHIKYLWLWDNLRECSDCGCKHSKDDNWAKGYWTRNITSSFSYAWAVHNHANLGIDTASSTDYSGVRPVITVLKDNLQG